MIFLSDPTGDKPTMPQLLSFQGKSKCINMAQEISVQWQIVGTILLDDENGTIMLAIAQQFANNAQDINTEILRRWVQGKGIDCTWHSLLNALSGPCTALAGSVREALKEEETAESKAGMHIMQCMT